MSAPDTDPKLASEIARQKQRAIERPERLAWNLGRSLIAGLVGGVGAWFIMPCILPMDRGDARVFDSIFAGFLTWVIYLGVGIELINRHLAKCPQCGCAWELPHVGPVFLTWKCCPGCGLKMSDETDGPEKP